jgi:hypothetical protein
MGKSELGAEEKVIVDPVFFAAASQITCRCAGSSELCGPCALEFCFFRLSLVHMSSKICTERPAGVQSLPVELIQSITSHLPSIDRTHLLLSASFFRGAIEQLVYEELYLSDTQLERNTLLVEKFSTRPDLAAVTQTLNIDLHGCEACISESCPKNIWNEVVKSIDDPDKFNGSCGCCHIEWKDALLPRVILYLLGVKTVNFTIHRQSWRFHEDFYRTFQAMCHLTLSSLSICTPDIDTNTRENGWCDVVHLLHAQPSLRHLTLMCHATISQAELRLQDSDLPLLQSFNGFYSSWKIVKGRPVNQIRFLCRVAGIVIPPGPLMRSFRAPSTGPIRDVTLVFADEIEWEKEPFVIAVLRHMPTLQRLVVETSHRTIEIPIQNMDIPAFLESLDPREYPP